MRIVFAIVVAGALAFSGRAHKKAAAQDMWGTPGAPTASVLADKDQKLIVTPDAALVGTVATVNQTAGFVILNFPLGRMPATDLHLNLYRRGLKVGEVKVTGPQQDDNTVADILTGDAQVGDELRAK